MKRTTKNLLIGALLMALPLLFASCEDILGEWDRPTPANVAPSGDGGNTPAPNMLKTPLTLEAAEAGAKVTFTIKVATGPVEYSTDGTNWSAYTSATPITLAAVGDKVMFRGTNATYAQDVVNCSKISCDKDCYIYGNIMSLIKTEGFENETTLTGDNTFSWLFSDNAHIKNHTDAAKNLMLPATKMTEYCYGYMFKNCTGLTRTPVIDVDCDRKNYCLHGMFQGCTNLTAVAEGSKISGEMGTECCYFMFDGCTNLASVPSDLLPSTELEVRCYYQMFHGCEKLEKAPKLPAETLKSGCYANMFKNCISLNEVWVKAGYDAEKSSEMFTGCPNAPTSKFHTGGSETSWTTAFSNLSSWQFSAYE